MASPGPRANPCGLGCGRRVSPPDPDVLKGVKASAGSPIARARPVTASGRVADDELDPVLIARARRGEAAAFEAIVRAYQDRVHALVWRLTYEAELARDVTQEVFIHLYERLDRYDPARPFTPWFMTLATNYALNARQKARLRRAASLDAPAPGSDRPREPADPAPGGAPEVAAGNEERRLIRRAIAELPSHYAGPVVLYYLEGLGVKEIAARLALPEGTVKIRLHRAREVLREKLERLRPGADGG